MCNAQRPESWLHTIHTHTLVFLRDYVSLVLFLKFSRVVQQLAIKNATKERKRLFLFVCLLFFFFFLQNQSLSRRSQRADECAFQDEVTTCGRLRKQGVRLS